MKKMNQYEIRKCRETEVVRVGQFYDRVVLWLNEHINYPGWIYRIYPSTDSARDMTQAGTQYICTSGEAIVGAFVLNEDPRGNYRNGRWSRDLDDGHIW